MPTLIAVGACYLDTILNVDHYPLEDEKLRSTKLERRRGGNVPNSLEVLQQLLWKGNHPTSLNLVSVLPDCFSTAVDQIRSSLGPAVDLSRCLYRESSSEAPSSYIFRSLATGSRTIVNYNDLEEMNVSEFENVADKLASSTDGQIIYHFEGRIPDVTVKCMDYVRNHYPEAKISVECEKPSREGLQALAQKADIVFYSKSWARAQSYTSAEDCVKTQALLAPDASYLFCTWGADGAAAVEVQTQHGNIMKSNAYLVEGKKVVDTVGAGDSFIAGALYGLFYRTWDLATTLGFANEVAGRKVAQEGFSGLAEGMDSWF